MNSFGKQEIGEKDDEIRKLNCKLEEFEKCFQEKIIYLEKILKNLQGEVNAVRETLIKSTNQKPKKLVKSLIRLFLTFFNKKKLLFFRQFQKSVTMNNIFLFFFKFKIKVLDEF